VTEQAATIFYNVVIRDEAGNETPRGRQPGYGRAAKNRPLVAGMSINLPVGARGEEWRPAGYVYTVEEIRDDGAPFKTLVLRPTY